MPLSAIINQAVNGIQIKCWDVQRFRHVHSLLEGIINKDGVCVGYSFGFGLAFRDMDYLIEEGL
jgi:hypothetical protein